MKQSLKRIMTATLSTVMIITSVSGLTIGASATAGTETTLTYTGAGDELIKLTAVTNVTVSDGIENNTADKVTVADNAAEGGWSYTLSLPDTSKKYISEVTVASDTAIISDDAKSVTIKNASSSTDPTAAITLSLVDAIVWIGGKDVKYSAAKDDKAEVLADFNKTAELDICAMYAGGTWTPVVTASNVTYDNFIAAKETVVAGNYFDEKGKIVKTISDATKKTLTAKYSKGTLKITAGSKLVDTAKSSETYKIWIAEISAAKKVTVTNAVKPFSFDVAVKVAPTNLFISTTDNATETPKVIKADTTAIVPVGGSETFFLNPVGIKTGKDTYGPVAPCAKYTIASSDTTKATVAATDNGFIVTGVALDNAKPTKITINVLCVQTQKTIKFKVTVCNPVKSIDTIEAKTVESSKTAATAVQSTDITATDVNDAAMTATTDTYYVYVISSTQSAKTDFSDKINLTNGKLASGVTANADVKAKLGTDKKSFTLSIAKGKAGSAYVYVVAYNSTAKKVSDVEEFKVTYALPAETPAATELTTIKPTVTEFPAYGETYAAPTVTPETGYTAVLTSVKGDTTGDATGTVSAQTYTLTITLTAKTNYKFKSTITKTDVTIDGYTVTDAVVSKTAADGDTLTITATVTITGT